MSHVSFPVDENRWPRDLSGHFDNTVVWDATDGPSTTTQWRIIVGSYSGGANYYQGPWQYTGGGGTTNNRQINLTTLPAAGTRCHIRAQYYIPGNNMMQNGVTSQFYYYP